MQKVLWSFLVIAVMMEARENPFESSLSPENVGQTTQIKDERTDFSTTKITLPSSARILKSATVTFQNLDGSISEEVVAIEQNVDWHLPLILSSQIQESQQTRQVSTQSAVASNKATEKPTAQSLPLQNNAETVQKVANKKVEPTIQAATTAGNTYKLNEDISFFINQKEITLFVKEAKIRDFLIAEPYKVVLDFKKENASYQTKTLEFQKAPFVSATLGTHDGFYRLAILLDGHYRYDLQAFNGGYIVKLK